MPLYPVKFAFSTEGSDRVEAVITAPKERRCVLHGTVYDENGQRAPDAVVSLYLREEGRLNVHRCGRRVRVRAAGRGQ